MTEQAAIRRIRQAMASATLDAKMLMLEVAIMLDQTSRPKLLPAEQGLPDPRH